MVERYTEHIGCPYCRQVNEPDASNCRWCGKALKPSFGDRPPLVGGGPESRILPWICQRCGGEIGPGPMPPARCAVCGRIVCEGCLARPAWWSLRRRRPIVCVECRDQ